MASVAPIVHNAAGNGPTAPVKSAGGSSNPAKTTTSMAMKATQSLAKSASVSLMQSATALAVNWQVEEYVARRRATGKITFRDHVYRALASPGTSKTSLIFTALLLTLSVASVIVAAWQLELEVDDRKESRSCPRAAGSVACSFTASLAVDYLFMAIFTLEWLLRVCVYVAPWKEWTLWLDLACIVPLYARIGLAAQGLRPLEVSDASLRTFVVLLLSLSALRLAKFARYFSGTVILKKALYDSGSALVIPVYLLIVLLTFMGGLIFAIEYDPRYDPNVDGSGRVTSLYEAWWMMLVTMTTVGYGDYSPQVFAGRVITSIAMLAGLCFTAMPLAIVGNTFSAAWEARTLLTIAQQLRRGLLEKGQTSTNLLMAFRRFDLDGNGEIDYREFKNVVVELLNGKMDVKKLRKVWRALDADDTGSIQYSEFCMAIFPEYEMELQETMYTSATVGLTVAGSTGEPAEDEAAAPNSPSLSPSLLLSPNDRKEAKKTANLSVSGSKLMDSSIEPVSAGKNVNARLATLEEASALHSLQLEKALAQQEALRESVQELLTLARQKAAA